MSTLNKVLLVMIFVVGFLLAWFWRGSLSPTQTVQPAGPHSVTVQPDTIPQLPVIKLPGKPYPVPVYMSKAEKLELDSLRRVVSDKDSLINYLSRPFGVISDTTVQGRDGSYPVTVTTIVGPVEKIAPSELSIGPIILPKAKEIDSVQVSHQTTVTNVPLSHDLRDVGVTAVIVGGGVAAGVSAPIAIAVGVVAYGLSYIF